MRKLILMVATGLTFQFLADIASAQTAGTPIANNEQRLALKKWWLGKNSVNIGGFLTGAIFDGKSIWIMDGFGTQLRKIDLNSQKVLTNVTLPSRVGTGVFDGQFLWLAGEDANLYKVQASDGKIFGSYALTIAKAGGVAYDGTFIWVTTYWEGKINKFNASTGARVGSYSTGGTKPTSVLFDGSHLWIANNGSNSLVRMNVGGGIVRSYPITEPNTLAFDGANIWVSSGPYAIAKLNPTTAQVATYSIGNGVGEILFDGSYIWATNLYNATIMQIRPADGMVIRQRSTSPWPWALGFDGAFIWVASQGGYVDRM